MIDTSHRFQGHGSLRFVYQRGQTIRGQYCSLRYIANSRRKKYRAAVVVSKKVSKSAVVRNRIRRRMYEAIRQATPDIAGAYDLVFVVYSDQLATLPSEVISQAVIDKLQKAGVLRADNGVNRAGHDIVEPKESLK